MPVADNKPNYPDILGLLTGGVRQNVGMAQTALAVRPRVVRAGRPFEAILVMQNAYDVPIDVTVIVQLPGRDVKGKKDRFFTDKERILVGLEAAEVGYLKMPISTRSDVAVGNDYKIALEISVKTDSKDAKSIRFDDGGGKVNPADFSDERKQELADLRKLKFSTDTKGFLRGNTLETTFGILGGKVDSEPDLSPGWVSIWSLEDHDDLDAIIDKHRETMKIRVLPVLNRAKLFEPLLKKTQERFNKAGYPLRDLEANYIAKVMTIILEYANPELNSHSPLEAGLFYFAPMLEDNSERVADNETYPHWAVGMFRALASDERVARAPDRAIPHFVYNELIHDAIIFAFKRIETVTGESLGAPEEMNEYAEHVVNLLKKTDQLDFSHAYMPLILGGITVYDSVMTKDEHNVEMLHETRLLLDERGDEQNEDNEPIFEMTKRIIDIALQKYGYIDR
jgi:hypothetical protein